MDIKVMLAAFSVIFLAEMADKTQVATVCMATGKSPWSVFIGSAAAMTVCSFFAVLVGCVLRKQGAIDVVWIRRAAAVLFILMGAWMMMQSFRPECEEPAAASQAVETEQEV